MQGSTPFHLMQLTEMPAIERQATDTANPYTPIPIFYFHSLEAPFCNNSRCKCHWQQREVRRLLASIVAGELTLREAAHLLDDVNGERKEP